MNRSHSLICSIFLALGFSMPGFSAEPSSPIWSQWRGPDRNSIIQGEEWPADLSDSHLSTAWTVPHSPSYSGPLIIDDRIFITETKDKKHEVVRALDRETGKQIWESSWEGSMKVPFFAAANGSWIRATPVYDGERLYVAGILDVVVCLDTKDGKVLWKLDFVQQTGSKPPGFGFASSPLVYKDALFVQAGGSVAKVDKNSGKIVWQTLKDGGGMYGSAFSSPTVATIAGQEQLVVQTRTKLAGVELDSGKVLWSQDVPAFRGMNILTPTLVGDAVFTSSYGGRSTLFDITRNGSTWNVQERWNHKSQGYMSSPVVIEDHIYLHLRNQRLVCLDAKTGEDRWTTTPFGKYWSMIANGKKLLALDQNGDLLLIAASSEKFQLIDRRKVANDSWAHLAIVGNEIVVRDLASTKKLIWK